MKGPANVVLCAVTTLLLLGRSDNEGSIRGIEVVESDSAGITIVDITGPIDLLPVWELSEEPITEVSGEAPPFLGSVGEVGILADGSLLIEDNQSDQIHRFNAAGEEVQVIARRGEGPGEFQNITSLTVTDGDTVYVYDRRLYRVTQFLPDGQLGFTLTVDRERAGPGALILDGWALDSDHLVLHSMGPGDNSFEGSGRRDQRDAVIHLVDREGAAIAPELSFTGAYSIRGSFGDVGAPLTNQPFVSVSSDRILHGSSIRYELVISDTDLQPLRIVRWDGWRRPFTEEDAGRMQDTLELIFASYREARPTEANALLGAMVNPDLLPDSLPAIGTAVFDDRGRIWVSDFIPSMRRWNDEGRSWHVLDSDGTPLAALRGLPLARLVAVRGNRVALVLRDELDVEHVRVFEVRMP